MKKLAVTLLFLLFTTQSSSFSARYMQINTLSMNFDDYMEPGIWHFVIDNTGAVENDRGGRRTVIFNVLILNYSSLGTPITVFQGEGTVEGGEYFVIDFPVSRDNQNYLARGSSSRIQIQSSSSSNVTFVLLDDEVLEDYRSEIQGWKQPPTLRLGFQGLSAALLLLMTVTVKRRIDYERGR